MFGRPRCREWTPLATQQLRLRSLIQIVGYNIRPPESCRSQCSFYLTLHHTTMSAPFYTSEKISSPHPKWKEIDPEIMQRMSSTNVVIRIWCHIIQAVKDKIERPSDTIIQTWGVYFSGLRYIGANLALNFTSDCFKSNTLVFQMHGGYFCSYKSLKLDIIPPENEFEHGSLSSDSSGKTNVSKPILEPKFIHANKLKESRSVSPSKYSRRIDKEYSKSHSPLEQCFKQNFPTIRPSTSLNITHSGREEIKNEDDMQEIYEQKPNKTEVEEFTISNKNCDTLNQNLSQNELTNSKIDLSETAESYDLRNEGEGTLKYRYLAINFLKSEIRQSYNANKLQKLHLLQYSIKKKQDAVQEIKESIYKKSAITEKGLIDCESDIRVKFKSRSQGNLFSPEENDMMKSQSDLSVKNGKVAEDKPISNGPRLTLKLNDLLSYKSKISPFQRSEHIRLTRQIEILRFKRIILSDERDSKLASIRRLKERHAKLYEENQDVGLDLMENYHTLSRRNDVLKETKLSCLALRELAARSHSNLSNRRCELLAQLLSVFCIEQHNEVTWKILNIPLPICGDDYIVQNPLRDSIAAGYAAQLLCLTAAILNQPLRYQITLKGSASEVLDANVDLPDPNIPLYVRSGDITLFRYGMFLLNKCIAQLLCGRGISVSNMRPTLHNLYTLISKPASATETSKLFGTYRWLADNQCPRTQSLRSLVASDRAKYRKFNRFKDAVDGQSPESAMNLRRHRHSKSVGSYVDQELSALDSTTTSIMGSEPNIYNTQLTQENLELQQRLLKSHNSDTEISLLSDLETEKVLFQLGDDTDIESNKLVRISSNNDDEITCSTFKHEAVKRICSEISGFCTANSIDQADHLINENDTRKLKIPENVDIAKYLDHKRVSDVPEEFEVSFDSCQASKDGVCETDGLKATNVIQGVEAILDSGQSEVDS